MELAPRCLLHCCNPGTCGVHTSMVFALLPTRTPMERFCAASSHLPRPTFSGPAITSKVLSRCLPFSGELKACLGMQAEVQDPFPGVWVLNHQLFTQLLIAGSWVVVLEHVTIFLDLAHSKTFPILV